MKIRILVSLLVLTLSYFLFSCKEGGGGRRSALPPVSGSTNELLVAVSYTHLRAHETDSYLVCRLLLEKIFFFNDTATTEIYTLEFVGSVRCV